MSTKRTHDRRDAGFSLVELLVSMVIALVVTLAITSVLVRSEGTKRSTTSVNDVNQNALYLSYMLDRATRNAGSGFAQRWNAYGCVIDARQNGRAILPLPGAAPAPFDNMPLNVRLAPILIAKSLANAGGQVRGDVITVMSGTAGGSDMPQTVRTSSVVAGSPSTLRVTNALGFSNSDIVLLADSSVTTGCMIQQVAPTAGVSADQLTFTGGVYSSNTGTVVNLSQFGNSTTAIQLGTMPPAAGASTNPPQMLMFGVDANNTLTSFDLLQQAGSAALSIAPVADGVIEMRALYGVDTTTPPDNVIDTWVDPVAGSGYSMAELTDGSNTAKTRMRSIIAVRIGLILRTNLQERISDRYPGQYAPSADPASLPTTTITLFSDLPAAVQQTRAIVGADNLYRYRAVEFTVPLRNSLYAPTSMPTS